MQAMIATRPPVVGYVLRMFPQTSETFIVNEVLELERLGLPIQVFSFRRPKEVVRHEGVRLIRAPVTYLPHPLYVRPRGLLQANQTLRRLEPDRYRRTIRWALARAFDGGYLLAWHRFLQATWLAHLVRRSEVRHLHAHFAHLATEVAMLASMLTGVSFSFTAHARDIYSRGVDYRLLREKVDRAQFVVTVSRFNRDFLRCELGPIAERRVHTIYNGVDLEKFAPVRSVTQEEDLILGVGRLIEKKGFSCLIRACRILQDRGRPFRCQIVGHGELRQRLEREIRETGLEGRIALVGVRSQEELPAYYHRAAVVAMPAVVARDGNRDALPTILLEALASGTPAVASRLTGIPEIVDHGENGLLVEPGDPVRLAEALELLLADRELRERLGTAARAKAERRFDLHRNVRQLYELYERSVEMDRGGLSPGTRSTTP